MSATTIRRTRDGGHWQAVMEPRADLLLTPEQAGEYLGGYSVPALAQLRYRGDGPAYVKLSARKVRYRVSDLDAWVAAKVRTVTDKK